MVISSPINTSFSRSVTPSQSSSDSRSDEDNQTSTIEIKAQEKALEQRSLQEKQQQSEDTQRRLDGRLISFGYDDNSAIREEAQSSVNRSRVNEAYTSPPSHEVTQEEDSHHYESDTIDIVV